jgi:hypothetical protein
MKTFFQELSEIASSMRSQLKALHESASALTSRAGITCKVGCGACCKKPNDVWATVAEMLPMAWDIFERGELDLFLENLQRQDSTLMCAVFKQHASISSNGLCSEYRNRPITCILFGSSLVPTKEKTYKFLGCSWQKEIHSDHIHSAELFADAAKYDTKTLTTSILAQIIDQNLREEFPINQALNRALELVGWADHLNQQSMMGPLTPTESSLRSADRAFD